MPTKYTGLLSLIFTLFVLPVATHAGEITNGETPDYTRH